MVLVDPLLLELCEADLVQVVLFPFEERPTVLLLLGVEVHSTNSGTSWRGESIALADRERMRLVASGGGEVKTWRL